MKHATTSARSHTLGMMLESQLSTLRWRKEPAGSVTAKKDSEPIRSPCSLCVSSNLSHCYNKTFDKDLLKEWMNDFGFECVVTVCVLCLEGANVRTTFAIASDSWGSWPHSI